MPKTPIGVAWKDTDAAQRKPTWDKMKAAGDCEPMPHTKANFDAAKVWLVSRHPFYGSFMMSMPQKWTFDVPKAGTDGTNTYFNPETCADLTDHEWRFLMCHEVMHVAHLHNFRGAKGGVLTKGVTPQAKKHHTLWNIACDLTINELLSTERGFRMPSGGVLPVDDPDKGGADWSKYAGQSPEYIYRDLYDSAKKAPNSDGHGPTGPRRPGDDSSNADKGGNPNGPDDGSQLDSAGNLDPDKLGDRTTGGTESGQGVRHVSVDWLHGDLMSPCDLSEAERKAAEQKARHMAATAAYHAQAMGSNPERVQQVLSGQKKPANWQMQLRNFVSSVVEKDDYSWAKPNRRYVPQGIYYPTLTGNKPPKLMALVIDISVSVSIDQLNKMWEEVAGVIQTHPNLSFETYFVNTEITEQRRISIADLPLDFDVKGYGGTSFAPAFQDIDDKGMEVSGLVYFTDMESRDYAPEPDYPVIWLNFDRPITKGGRYFPPYGEVVNMI